LDKLLKLPAVCLSGIYARAKAVEDMSTTISLALCLGKKKSFLGKRVEKMSEIYLLISWFGNEYRKDENFSSTCPQQILQGHALDGQTTDTPQ